MLLKLRNRPERRLQARREHDACATRGPCPPLQHGPDRADRGWPWSRGSFDTGRFQLRGSGKPDSAASAAPRRQQLGRRKLPGEATRGEPGHDR
jgi:hypothetical protein